MRLRAVVLISSVLFIALLVTIPVGLAQDVVSPDGKVGVRIGVPVGDVADQTRTEVYDIKTGETYGAVGGGTDARFAPDSQSVMIENAKIDSYGTTTQYKIFCRH